MEKDYQNIINELKSLKKQNLLLTQLLENSKDVLYRMALPEGRYDYISPACSTVFGYTPEEFYSRPLLIKEILHPDWTDYFTEQWRLLLSGEMPPYYEFQVIDSQGKATWIHQKNVLFTDERGSPTAIEGIISDISERKELEEKLSVNISRLTEAQQLASIGYWYWDINTGDVEWSMEIYNIFGLDFEKFKPNIDSIMALSPWPEENNRDREIMQKAIEGKKSGYYEQRFLLPSGETGYYLSTFQGIYDDAGTLIAIKGAIQDITKRKRAEEALRSSEQRFRDLVEMLPEAVFETTLNLELTFANQRAHELFGYTREDLSLGLNGIEMIAPEDRDRLMKNMQKRILGDDGGRIEYMAQKKDGTVFPVLFHASPVLKDNKVAGFRGILMDMTERKEAEKEKTRLEDQYRQAQKVESIGRLAGGVAHDLNNLLTPILGYSEMLIDDLEPNEIYDEALTEIYQAGMRARNLISQLLAFSRKQTLEYKTLDMNDIITGIKKLLRHTIREDIKIDIISSPMQLIIRADIGQIEQVIINIAVNAQDAMPSGGTITIETGMVNHDKGYSDNHFGSKPGSYVMLAMSDNGTGMDSETREKIFEPFFSTKGEMGTGLGMATVYGIIKQHSGNIFVYSEPEKGTTFKIYLPCYSADQVTHPDTYNRKEDRKNGNETILLAEDNDNVRMLIKKILYRWNYNVIEAKNGTEALKMLDACGSKIHLLLTDVIMPEMNGRDLYSAALEKQPDLKVLYMSGYTDSVIEHHGILNAGISFIQKPFSHNALAAKIREVLDS